MKPPNPERERELYDLWSLGYTIDQATYHTTIPRSTIGYYFKKFKKRDRKNGLTEILRSEFDDFNIKGPRDIFLNKPYKELKIEEIIRSERAKLSKKKSPNETLTSITGKFLATKELIALIDKEDYVNLFFILSCLKILNEIIQHLKLDPEELTSIMKAFQNKSQQKI